MEKRYQVFVSSTYQDLQQERREVMQALLELNCIPSGMELFPAANESQWNVIKRVISESDYYMLILGGRYGSIPPHGEYSYTEMEYRYAIELGKPVIGFLHRDPGSIAAAKCEITEVGKAKLIKFRELVSSKLCKFWETPEGLGSVVSRSIVQLKLDNPTIGWVRADQLPDKDAMVELLRLREENDKLKEEIARTRTSAPAEADGLAQGNDEYELAFLLHHTESGKFTASDETCSFTWDTIFSALGQFMISEASDNKLIELLNRLILQGLERSRKDFASLANVRVEAHSWVYHNVIIQFRALGLVTKSRRQHSIKDTSNYWSLTPYGDAHLTNIRAIRKKNALQSGVQ